MASVRWGKIIPLTVLMKQLIQTENDLDLKGCIDVELFLLKKRPCESVWTP